MNNNKILFVMGNGPSLSEIMNNDEYLNFIKKHDSFGLNAAYRAYDKYNFYPTYFGCFDYVVNKSHKHEFEKLVNNNNDIKEYYFIGNQENNQLLFSDTCYNNQKFIKFNFKNINPSKFKKISSSFDNFINIGSSGANAAQVGIMKNYKKIILLGCDCNYIEIIDSAEKLNSGNQLIISKKVDSNPNYWFNEYQQVGDIYNKPNTSIYQLGSWSNLHKYCPPDVEILNCSEISKIPYFKKINFSELIN